MKEDYIIPLNGLGEGRHVFNRHVGKEFFEDFGCSDIIDSDLDAVISVEKNGKYTGIDCSLDGVLTVPCDRCSEALDIPVSKIVRLSVKFGPEPSSKDPAEASDSGREVVYLPEDEASMDMSQIIYDYSILSLPMKKVHAEGECNPEALKYLVSEMPDAEGAPSAKDPDNSPFAALKGLFDN